MQRRIISLWFPRLASDRVLRAAPVDVPFALTQLSANTARVYCLNAQAGAAGVARGMALSEARVRCGDLQTAPADLHADTRFLSMLGRWAGRYCPWVAADENGLVLDISGSAHLFGGEAAMIDDLSARLVRAGLAHSIGLADTRGAAWALARHGGGVADAGGTLARIGGLPVAALRIDGAANIGLQRLGVRRIAELVALPRATVSRRFGVGVLLRLDQALGMVAEPVAPRAPMLPRAVRMTLPEPIGLQSDIIAGLDRLLERLCATLARQELGARAMQFTARRVDQGAAQVEVRFARPMRDAARIAALFVHGLEGMEAGFGIDQIRLEAIACEPMAMRQVSTRAASGDRLADLITRLGNRIGLGAITRYLPADTHIPEKAFNEVYAAYTDPAGQGAWPAPAPRPLLIFPPEPVSGAAPDRFRWRRMFFSSKWRAGPERITPEWWLDDRGWRSGLRDYWRVETGQGRRLWLFFTPQSAGWFAQGEFA